MLSERIQTTRTRGADRGLTISIGAHWNRIGLAAILFLAAVLDFYGLNRAGYGNTYYAAAVKSMMQNWHAFWFNSLDPAGFVTLDKPPLGFWLQVLSAKIFGFDGVALMLPQALAGVLSVALLYHLVARIFGPPAGLLAALALAVTPISVVGNRNNIVDSTLVLAVLLGAWAVSRAVETGRLRWLLLCALFVGLGFNIKMLEAYLVLPAFGLMYLLGARVGWGRRILQLLVTGIVLLVISLFWVMSVDLTPASQRPWVGSTTTNSELDLAIGYNGLQRLTGNRSVGGQGGFGSNRRFAQRTTGSSGGASPQRLGGPGGAGGPGGVGENGPAGPLRLLNSQLGGQIGWLLPLAVIGLLAAAWNTRRRWPLDERQSALVMWGAWLVTMDVFFNIAGFYHTYYLVMIAPAIAALSGIGITALWRIYRQSTRGLWLLFPLSLIAATVAEVHILADYPTWSRWLSPLILALAVLGALLLILLRLRPRVTSGAAIAAVLLGAGGLLAAPGIWSIQTVQAAQSGLLPRAGPAGLTGGGGPGGFGRRNGSFRPPNGAFAPPGGAPGPGGFQPPTGAGSLGGRPGYGFFRRTRGGFRFGPGGPGGGQVNKQLVKYLESHQGTATYLFGTTSVGTAESYIIATGKAVMAMGGFTGSDPILNASKLASLVKDRTVRYFLLGGGFGGPGGDGGGSAGAWVQSHCSAVPVSRYSSGSSSSAAGGALYDCGTVR